eukprot:sb/3476816/
MQYPNFQESQHSTIMMTDGAPDHSREEDMEGEMMGEDQCEEIEADDEGDGGPEEQEDDIIDIPDEIEEYKGLGTTTRQVAMVRLDLRFLEIGVLHIVFTKRDPEFPGISGQVV